MPLWLSKLYYRYFVPFSSTGRSPLWSRVSTNYLSKHPVCEICGTPETPTIKLVVHHKKPYTSFPELELSDSNLVTLCTPKSVGGRNCHLTFGHLYSWSSYNPSINEDISLYSSRFSNRP